MIEAEEIRQVERREDAEAHARKRRRNLHVYYIVRHLSRNDGMVMSYSTEYYKRHAVVFTRWSNAIPTSAPSLRLRRMWNISDSHLRFELACYEFRNIGYVLAEMVPPFSFKTIMFTN